jgi:hypothetical protein
MKRILTVILALGCGSGLDADSAASDSSKLATEVDNDAISSEQSELATLVEPICTTNPYGATDNSFECIHPETGWQGGHCYAPDRKAWVIQMCGWDGDTELAFDERTAAFETIDNFAALMNIRGWDIDTALFLGSDLERSRTAETCNPSSLPLSGQTIPNCCLPGGDSTITVRRSDDLGGGNLSFNFIETSGFPFGDLKCSDTSAGEFCQYSGEQSVAIKTAKMRLDCPAFQAASQQGQAQLRDNIVRHELFHALGLGHTDTGGLMDTPPAICESGNELTNQFFLERMLPTDAQMHQIQEYNPDGNTCDPILRP